jgi:hypothetical protein
MNFFEFNATLGQNTPPADLNQELLALWYAGKGDWHQSHEIAQQQNTPGHCLVHAYLHRQEGDEWNANYWYQRAGRKMPKGSLSQEWEALVQEFLRKP